MDPERTKRSRGGWALVGLVLGCASGPGQVESPAADQARELMRAMRSRNGNLLLRCEPEDAEVYLDGVLQGVCTDFGGKPSGLRVGLGLHRIDVKKDGYWPYTTYFEPSNARAGLTITLKSMAPERGGSD
ncbi:MAG TPA: PEGA domain-containing protein [Archangium sp.]|uniref:PEGA domain-containing protein n=1 Tax=Archangium sp. TaxID=1872627 RepID=UPI002E335154|nr:PEGA domain-containing protein [Archangium sp.]HEX5745782.1 PEGA domain-containing protein [Archangium sp.]